MSSDPGVWGIVNARLVFFSKMLSTHENVASFRQDGVCFDVVRKYQKDQFRIICLEQYAAGVTIVQKVLDEFADVKIIHIGGEWNAYTKQAKEMCLDRKIGLYIYNEAFAAIFRDDYWAYVKKDKDGNRVHPFRKED